MTRSSIALSAPSYAAVLKGGPKPAPLATNAPEAPSLPESFAPASLAPRVMPEMAFKNMCGVQMPRWKDQKLTEEVELITRIGEEHRNNLGFAADSFNMGLKAVCPEAKSFLTGSYAAGIDVDSSDLDFTLRIPSEDGLTSYQQLRQLREKFLMNNMFKNVKLVGGRVPVLTLVHEATGIDIDVTVGNDVPKRNTLLLAMYGQVDQRFPLLCRAIKKWAANTGVECSKQGRINSFSICLMVIHYLQCGVSPPILPNLQKDFPELNEEMNVEEFIYRGQNILENLVVPAFTPNESSLGALYWGFFKYYNQFDFQNDWISIRNAAKLEKKWDEESTPLNGLPENSSWFVVLEDPFMVNPWNCGGTLRDFRTFGRFKKEFERVEKEIRENHKIYSEKSVRRLRIDGEGKAGDLKIEGVELALDRAAWECRELAMGRVKRQCPKSFWEEKDEYNPWPERLAEVSLL